MGAGRTARERARAEITEEILREARAQLASQGAAALSLRAVARSLGMASSAVYRYFASRDELLTELIVEAYDALGGEVEGADAACAADDVGARWRDACRAVRGWALAHPHEYALVYGSPVPGYRAPERTVGPAARIPLALVGILRHAHEIGALATPPDQPVLSPEWHGEARRVAALIAPGLPDGAVVRAFVAWSQLFGLVSFELFGHLVGSVEDTSVLFDAAVATMGAVTGLPAPARADQRVRP